jgi:hypothetical protein
MKPKLIYPIFFGLAYLTTAVFLSSAEISSITAQANAGDATAQLDLGTKYLLGKAGVPKDFDEALACNSSIGVKTSQLEIKAGEKGVSLARKIAEDFTTKIKENKEALGHPKPQKGVAST